MSLRVLQIHNKYRTPGGEDVLAQMERDLLVQHGHIVDQLFFDNHNIPAGWWHKVKAGIDAIYNFSSAREVQSRITSFQPDIIHVINFFPLLSPSVFYVASRNRIPIVATINNYRLICANALLFRENQICERCINSWFPLSGIRYRCYHNSAIQSLAVTLMATVHKSLGTWQRKVDKFIIAMTDYGRVKFLNSSLHLPPEKSVLKPNFVADPGEGIQPREDYYVFFARLSPEKGVETLLQSLDHYPYRLKIIGDGPLRSQVEQCVQKNPNVEYLGLRKLDEVMEIVKKCRAVIMPSIWYEALPLSVIGTLATGTPSIISDVPSFLELIEEGTTGFHFKTGDAKDLAEKIRQFDSRLKENQPMYQHARQVYLRSYSPQSNYHQLLSIYQSVLRHDA